MGQSSPVSAFLEWKKLSDDIEAAKARLGELDARAEEMTGLIERDTAVLERERARFEEIAGAHRDDALQLERLEQDLSEAQAESESLDKEEKRIRYLALELRAFLREFYVRPAATLSRCADSWESLLERDIKALKEIGAGLPDQKRSQVVSLDRDVASFVWQDWRTARNYWSQMGPMLKTVLNKDLPDLDEPVASAAAGK